MLNVARGGTLLQHIASQPARGVDHDPRKERRERVHEVEIRPGTRLHRILKREAVSVNTFHHQAIEALGEGLKVSALSAEDLIEGIELPTRRFTHGVQWHPESLWREPDGFQPLFEHFVAAGQQP